MQKHPCSHQKEVARKARKQIQKKNFDYENYSAEWRNIGNKVYTNVDPVLRHAVDQIQAGDWL